MRGTYLFISIFLFCAISCQRTVYVPVENVRTEIQYKDRLRRDSIFIHDSINTYQKGDSVFRDRWHKEYIDRFIHDTTFVHLTDSIQIPYPVEKQLSSWEKLKIETGGIALGILAAGCTFGLLYIIRRFWRKK